MAVYDASNAQCHIFTYKEGVLSAIAHDLKIRVTEFYIEVSDTDGSIRAEFDPGSLKVVCAMVGSTERASSLSESDKSKIERTIFNDVLNARRFPTVRFTSNDIREAVTGPIVSGELELHGSTKTIEAVGRRVEDRLELTVTLMQPDFGIKPYRAMMGTLRIQPRVKVQLSVPNG